MQEADLFYPEPARIPAWALGLLVMLIALVGACGSSEYRTPLPGGYSLLKAHGTGVAVLDSGNSFLIGPDISDFDVRNDVLVGRVVTPPSDFPATDAASPPGYFLFDTRNGTLRTGLTESQWREALEEANLPPDLALDGIPWRFNTSPAASFFRAIGWMLGIGALLALVAMGVSIWGALRIARRSRTAPA